MVNSLDPELSMATLANPHRGTTTEGGWAMGFSWGFVGPAFSRLPPLVIAPDQLAAFNEGVLAGQQAAIEGLSIEPACVSLSQEVNHATEAVVHGVHLFELIGLGVSAFHKFKHFGAEAFAFVFLFLIPGPPNLDPATKFGMLEELVRTLLVTLGLTRNSLFLAAGVDQSVAGCELLLTPIFTRIEDARAAVQALGRPHWFIARWDAHAPVSGGGFAVIETDFG
jgi:hypothetical protein